MSFTQYMFSYRQAANHFLIQFELIFRKSPGTYLIAVLCGNALIAVNFQMTWKHKSLLQAIQLNRHASALILCDNMQHGRPYVTGNPVCITDSSGYLVLWKLLNYGWLIYKYIYGNISKYIPVSISKYLPRNDKKLVTTCSPCQISYVISYKTEEWLFTQFISIYEHLFHRRSKC